MGLLVIVLAGVLIFIAVESGKKRKVKRESNAEYMKREMEWKKETEAREKRFEELRVKYNEAAMERAGKLGYVDLPCPYCGCSEVVTRCGFTPKFDLLTNYDPDMRRVTEWVECKKCGESSLNWHEDYIQKMKELKEQAASSIAAHNTIWGVKEITEQQIDDYIDMIQRGRQIDVEKKVDEFRLAMRHSSCDIY